jgi:hypothetical protein
MNTLQNYKLLIDADCPMCRIYGNAFEKHALIEKGTCSPYQTIDVSFSNCIDMARAKNEIALFNTKTQETVYGIEAFQTILANSFQGLKPIFRSKFISLILKKLYKFISTNRKVIAPSTRKENQQDCTPDLNVKYRIFYIIFVALFSSIVLNRFTITINTMFGWQSSFYRELMVCFGQILWQTVLLRNILKDKLYDYLGNMMTVSMIGTLLLLPFLAVSSFINIHAWGFIIYFGVVVNFMLFEHLRRCKILNISIIVSISWIVYRIIVLGLIEYTK